MVLHGSQRNTSVWLEKGTSLKENIIPGHNTSREGEETGENTGENVNTSVIKQITRTRN